MVYLGRKDDRLVRRRWDRADSAQLTIPEAWVSWLTREPLGSVPGVQCQRRRSKTKDDRP